MMMIIIIIFEYSVNMNVCISIYSTNKNNTNTLVILFYSSYRILLYTVQYHLIYYRFHIFLNPSLLKLYFDDRIIPYRYYQTKSLLSENQVPSFLYVVYNRPLFFLRFCISYFIQVLYKEEPYYISEVSIYQIYIFPSEHTIRVYIYIYTYYV